MGKIYILSNRLPFKCQKIDEDFRLTPSVGGLATGMNSIYRQYNGKWIGWTGLASDNLSEKDKQKIDIAFEKEQCLAIHLNKNEIKLYYEGFSNRTIWPLFHYFTEYIYYDKNCWEAYVEVNRKFAEAALTLLEDGDTIWVHDYQLLLAPQMIKEKKPFVTIGFFLHIPFPSFEVFRILPWRKELLDGMLGADLLGFHTYDYERHFFSCIRRLMGHEITFNQIHLGDRIILADAFPMGIDYEKFEKSALALSQKSESEQSDFHRDLNNFFQLTPSRKLILSIDRMDYTKGIPNRLRAFSSFLEKYTEFQGRITLIMLVVPSRGKVDQYIRLKSTVEQLVGKINGRFGSINYTPVWYFYRALPFESLIELYISSDVALITPVRDGMNLVAKEYVASRIDNKGVIILSEMAGASKELGEALTINPNDPDKIADGIYQALTMPESEQQERMLMMQQRIKRYDVFKWAGEFVNSLEKVKQMQKSFNAKKISRSILNEISKQYKQASTRALFLDYDGTLTPFHNNPQSAKPKNDVLTILKNLTSDIKNEIIIISGRDKSTLETWFEGLRVHLIAEHGVWSKFHGDDWKMIYQLNNDWKEYIRSTLENFVDRTPGSFIEEKNYSLVWHYRKSEPDQAALRANELKDELTNLIANHNLEIMEGNKVIEVKSGGINKGVAALRFIGSEEYDFILSMGDDWTDEYMFRELPQDSFTIKVGLVNTMARYKVDSVEGALQVLTTLAENTGE